MMLDGDKLSGKAAYEYTLKVHKEHERLRSEREAQKSNTYDYGMNPALAKDRERTKTIITGHRQQCG